jgi:outer membrane protein insertion porin family
MNLGFFETVRNRPEMTSNPGERDLVFDVEEKRTGQIMLGAGFSSIDNLMFFADISQGNFDIGSWPPVGGGQKLKLSTQLGSKRSDVTLSFVEPWFLDRRLSLGVDLYRNQVSYDEYDMERIGTAVSLARPLFGNVRGNLQYRLEREKVTDMADTNAYFYADNPEESYGFMRNENLLYSSLRFTMTRDSRDNPFVPRSGNLLTGFAGFAGGPLGADVDLYEVGFRSAHYLPLWFKHVVSLRLRYETVESYGGMDVVPVGSRLFAGGGRTIRGFEYRDVGPKVALKDEDGELVERSHKPVGGQSLAVANLEYTVPVFSMLRLAAFYDTGNVWRDSFDFEASGLAAGWGVGVRVDIPGFPIRIDRAWAVRKDDPMTDEEIVVFWIGYDN